MKKYNVYGVSDWPEEMGKEFEIFIEKEFASVGEAVKAAKETYCEDLEIIIKEV